MVMMSTPLKPSAGRPVGDVPDDNPFGKWLRAERINRGLTGEALAFLVGGGMSQGRISSYERGIKKPERESVFLLADALAGPDATEDERESLRNEALRASVGIETQEIERSVLMERWGGRYDGLAESEELIAAAESHLNLLLELREAQKRQAIGGTGEAPKTEEPKK
jgi:transcriptional regulator with XRE-family HTH domain